MGTNATRTPEEWALLDEIEIKRMKAEPREPQIVTKDSPLYEYAPLLLTYRDGWSIAYLRKGHTVADRKAIKKIAYVVWPTPELDIMLQMAKRAEGDPRSLPVVKGDTNAD